MSRRWITGRNNGDIGMPAPCQLGRKLPGVFFYLKQQVPALERTHQTRPQYYDVTALYSCRLSQLSIESTIVPTAHLVLPLTLWHP